MKKEIMNVIGYFLIGVIIAGGIFAIFIGLPKVIREEMEWETFATLNGNYIVETCDKLNVCETYDTSELIFKRKGGMFIEIQKVVEFEHESETIVVNINKVKIKGDE